MMELFSPAWMQAYLNQWNAEAELVNALAKIDFNSTIGYGFKDDPHPTGILVVENGKAVAAGFYTGQFLNWDLRATKKTGKNGSKMA